MTRTMKRISATESMRRLLPIMFSLLFVFTALAETAHCEEQAADEPCASVCLSNCCGLLAADPDPRVSAAPAPDEVSAAVPAEAVFVYRILEDEIFHPPPVS